VTMARVRDGVIVELGLPETGVLSDGSTVTNYHLLSLDTLITEGWVPVEEPEVEPQEGMVFSGWDYEVDSDRVIRRPLFSEEPPIAAEVDFAEVIRVALEVDSLSMSVYERRYFQHRFEQLLEEMREKDPLKAQALWDRYRGVDH
jgi:hypothetical protein